MHGRKITDTLENLWVSVCKETNSQVNGQESRPDDGEEYMLLGGMKVKETMAKC